jgi:dihydroorotate dehydrogenase electron transfer subunit
MLNAERTQTMMSTTSMPTAACATDARVIRCDPICREHVSIELSLPAFPPSQPGQFLQLRCAHGADDADAVERPWPADGFPSLAADDLRQPQAYLRRPFSIADRRTEEDGSTRLVVTSHTVGMGTAWLTHLQPGDTLNISGPLGHGFRLPEPGTPVVAIGGGVGIPPLMYLARRLYEHKHTGVTYILGVQARDLLPVTLLAEPPADAEPTRCAAYPADAAFATIITSDDGSVGFHGRVTDALRAWHAQHPAPQRPTVLTCGPEPMLRAVAAFTRDAGWDCQLCIERHMGCGMGTCLSCVVRARDARRPDGWRWALTCTDGPVFDRDDLLDDEPASSA